MKADTPSAANQQSAASARGSSQSVRNPYSPLDAVLVRTPILAMDAFQNQASVRAEWIEPAITVASLSLSRAESKSAAQARLRYRIRMATRPTPYGLFSGVALGQWGDWTDFELEDAPPRTSSRPDMGWLLRLVMDLEARRDVRVSLSVNANPTAFVRGGRIILQERMPHLGDGTVPPRVSVRATSAALLILQLARAPINFLRLMELAAAAAPGVSRERLEELVHTLLDQNLLVTDLCPPLTCNAPSEELAAHLDKIPAAHDLAMELRKFLASARNWDRLPADKRAAAYLQLARDAAHLGAKPDEPPLQVDTSFALTGNRISREVGEEVAKAAWLLMRITPYPRGFPYINAYRQAFLARFGERREVPILELLDPYWGLGPPDPNAVGEWNQFPQRDQCLLDLATRALRDRQLVVHLHEADIARMDTMSDGQGILPASMDVCAFVCASPGGVDRGDFSVVIGPNVGAMLAGSNMGRFANTLGQPARAVLDKACALQAKGGDALAAEVVYLPRRFRLANVAIRPVSCDHQLVLGVSPGVPTEQTIPMDELTVGIDEGGFYLRWPGVADRVIVTSSHMLNFNEAHPLAAFLARMRADGETQLQGFDWGPASAFPFLPRVQVGRAILRAAQWRLDGMIDDRAQTAAAFNRFLRGQRRDWRIPRHIYLSMGDVRLLLDLDDQEHVEQLRLAAQRVATGGQVLLQEALPGPDHAWVPGPGGHYVTEIVVPLARSEFERAEPFVGAEVDPVLRMVPPSGQWLYFKLYGSVEAEDDLLTGALAEFCEQVDTEMFFIRYSDPDPHLRLRFRSPTIDVSMGLMSALCALGRSLMDKDLCSRFSFDTYDREIERYGGADLIEATESLFVADSAVAIQTCRFWKAGDRDRKIIAAATALDLLDALGVESAMPEFGTRLRSFWLEAGSLFRTAKEQHPWSLEGFEGFLNEEGGEDVIVALNRRRVAAMEMSAGLQLALTRGNLTCPPVDLCHSLLHMHCNRLLGRDREDERLVLGLMLRLHSARRARSKS